MLPLSGVAHIRKWKQRLNRANMHMGFLLMLLFAWTYPTLAQSPRIVTIDVPDDAGGVVSHPLEWSCSRSCNTYEIKLARRKAAIHFAEHHKLYQGMGCGSRECVLDLLSDQMRMRDEEIEAAIASKPNRLMNPSANQIRVRITYGKSPRTFFLFKPAIGTLRAGFSSLGVNVTVDQISPGVDLNERYQFENLDMLVWVGPFFCCWAKMPPWDILRSRGTYVVYYQTEPDNSACHFKIDDVDEVWDYSPNNVKRCAGLPRAPILMRHLPPGSIGNNCYVSQPASAEAALVFLGDIDVVPRRRLCWEEVKKQGTNTSSSLKERLVSINNAWTRDDLMAVFNKSSTGIFLNLHKECGRLRTRPYPPAESFRFAMLLQVGGLIISERCSPEDEQMYDGLVDFVDHTNIGRAFDRLIQMNQEERQQLADARAVQFRRQFSPRFLFEQADIPDLIKQLGGEWMRLEMTSSNFDEHF